MKQFSGYMPFGARRTMTQNEEDLEPDDHENNEETLKEVLRLFIFEFLKRK